MSELGRGKCTYLIDDLPSELDREHSELVCRLLSTMQAQVFITSVERQDITDVWPDDANLAVFHVEQGVLQQSNP